MNTSMASYVTFLI